MRRLLRLVGAGFVVLLSVAGSGATLAQTVTLHPSSIYSTDTAAMDAALGITSFSIEDFEDSALVAGLTVEHTNPDSGPSGTLPNLYVDGSGVFFNNHWDEPGALVSTFDNIIWFPPVESTAKLSARTTFHFSVPLQTFGVGLGNFQAENVDHALLVNGVEVVGVLETLPTFTSGVNVRNGYLIVEATAGTPLSSVAFETRVNGTTTPGCCGDSGSDGLILDHAALELAGTGMPSLSTLGMAILCSLLGLAGLRWLRGETSSP